jgi:hypothetical protein
VLSISSLPATNVNDVDFDAVHSNIFILLGEAGGRVYPQRNPCPCRCMPIKVYSARLARAKHRCFGARITLSLQYCSTVAVMHPVASFLFLN